MTTDATGAKARATQAGSSTETSTEHRSQIGVMVTGTETADSDAADAGESAGAAPKRDRRARPARRRPRPAVLWLGVAALAAAATGAGYILVGPGGDAGATAGATDAGHTAPVARETLADTRRFTGPLGHGEAVTVSTSGQGIITGIADQGTDVVRGTELFRINERPVTALYGSIPMYRDLGPGSSGADVEQLNDNLAELGHGDCAGSDEYLWCTQSAVRDWQDDLGAKVTGSVAQSDVVFVGRGSVVDTRHQEVGGVVAHGAPVLDLTSADQIASLEVGVRDRDLFAGGTQVTVRLPGGDEVPGEVTSASAVGGGEGADGSADDTYIQVEVTLTEEVDESLLGATVDVLVEVEEREDVLTVPVNALLALSGGGHGVEVIGADGAATIVPVETGLFAQGRVEISGEGIQEGVTVGVAGR